jgi:superfamily I DNA/RNA helicase
MDNDLIRDNLRMAGLPSPSYEQLNIIKAAKQGKNIKVQAFAGTGKTTTIKMISACINLPATYVVFNRAAKENAENGIINTRVITAHGLAYSEIITPSISYKEKFSKHEKTWFISEVEKIFPQYSKVELARIIRTVKRFTKSIEEELTEKHIHPIDLKKLKKESENISNNALKFLIEVINKLKNKDGLISDKVLFSYFDIVHNDDDINKSIHFIKKILNFDELKSLIINTLDNYEKYSDDEKITIDDFPHNQTYKKLIQSNNTEDSFSYQQKIDRLVSDSQLFWEKISSEEIDYPINHDCYLKVWQLSRPRINTPVIFVDESQDLDPVMLCVLMEQQAQMIWFGDKYQQIYEWRGAINAMDYVKNCENFSLTETYRFPSDISHVANVLLAKLGEPLKINSKVMTSDREVKVTAYLARYNKTLIDIALNLAEQNKNFTWTNFDVTQLCRHCLSIINLNTGDEPVMNLYSIFKSVEELEQYLEEEGTEIMRKAFSFCKVFHFNYILIQEKLKLISIFNKPQTDTILTTAHQSKGLEWDKVILASDFEHALLKKNFEQSEYNLLYVAVTRTKNILVGIDPLIALISQK